MQTAANYHIYMEMEGARMIQKEKMRNEQETISIEEYLNRRRKLREKERRNRKEQTYEKESSPWMLAELSMT